MIAPLCIVSGAFLLAWTLLARCLFLARWRAGWAMYLANIAWEVFPKKLGIGRFKLEAVAALSGLALLGAGGVPWVAVAIVGGILLALEVANRRLSRRLVNGPFRHDLILTLEGPFVARRPRVDLGVRCIGLPFELTLVVSNPSPDRTHSGLNVRLVVPGDWAGGTREERRLPEIPSGGVAQVAWTLCPRERREAGTLEMIVEGNGFRRCTRIHHAGCRASSEMRGLKAGITRYPGGRRSAFMWRGDMDLYDKLTFQSIEGLEAALGLSARYGMAQTMYLSTRLSLDATAAKEWAAHDGRDHGAEEIPAFIEWMKAKVDLRHVAPYPAVGDGKPYVLELGNHGHLHYDTAAAAAPENGWTSHAKMGAGRYPWVGEDTSSFGEQRDNILEAARWCDRFFGFVPRSWAKPGRCNDADTARAAEAAGCEVLSGSDIRARDNVLFQPPPHHPGGTHAVELTSRHPCDPQHVHHWAMVRFWLHRSARRGIPMVFMCHQHMRQWEGPACMRFTEAILRAALADFNGDFFVDTVFGVGKYWREVLSPTTRTVTVSLAGRRLVVENGSDMDLAQVPVDLEFDDGSRSTVLVDVPGGQTMEVELKE